MDEHNYQLALTDVIDFINGNQMTEWNYNGVIDITEVINFHEVGKRFNLSEDEYELLIDEAQEIATKKLNSFDHATGFEKQYNLDKDKVI